MKDKEGHGSKLEVSYAPHGGPQIGSKDPCEPQTDFMLIVGSLREGGPREEGYLGHVGEPRGAWGNTREFWEVLSYLLSLDPPRPYRFHPHVSTH